MQFDWARITSLAYLTLLEFNFNEFPITTKKIKCNGVIISSYQNYAKKTGLSIDEITLGNELEDAFLLKGLRPDVTLILYNKEKYAPRMRHTLVHEIGHIKCGHSKHSEKEEIEAHFFASQTLAPNIIIKSIAQRGYTIDIPFLKDCFGISYEAAKKKQEYLQRFSFDHTNEYDDLVFSQFSNFLDRKYPAKSKYINDNFEEMENKRQNWQW